MNERRRIISILVDNTSGVLARVAGLFARRNYNIDTLTVSATDDAAYSRITITFVCSDAMMEQIIHQTEKLFDTCAVMEIAPETSIQRELLLIKLAANENSISSIRDAAEIYKASIVDLSPDSMVIELTGKPSKIDSFLEIVSRYGILELCRTGITALSRGGANTIKSVAGK